MSVSTVPGCSVCVKVVFLDASYLPLSPAKLVSEFWEGGAFPEEGSSEQS